MNFDIKLQSCAATLVMALAMAASPVLAQQSLADLEAAAKAEGRLLIYSANQDAEMEAKLAAFETHRPRDH